MSSTKYLTDYNVIIDEEEKYLLELTRDNADECDIYWTTEHDKLMLTALRTKGSDQEMVIRMLFFLIVVIVMGFLIIIYKSHQQ